MQARETKERKERTYPPRIASVPESNRLISECRSAFYIGQVRNILDAVHRYLPRALTNIVLEYSNINDFNIEIIKQLARSDDQNNPLVIDARARLGSAYYRGEQISRNFKEGNKWLILASKAENLPAGLFALGLRLMEGIGMRQDTATAIAHFESAAKQEYAPAQFELGLEYKHGGGITHRHVKDIRKAIEWFRLAAKQGYAPAQFELGICYRYGQGIAQNTQKAVSLFRLAAEKRYARATYFLGKCYAEGKGIPRDNQEVVKWYLLAVKQGHVRAQYDLGQYYEKIAKNKPEAIKWYKKAAKEGIPEARISLISLGVPEKELSTSTCSIS